MHKKTQERKSLSRSARRGRQAVDLRLLRKYAEFWRVHLFLVRDGQPAVLVEQKLGKVPVARVEILRPSSKLKRFLGTLENLRGGPGKLWFRSPVFPKVEIWNQLKDACSTAEMEKGLDGLEKFLRQFWHPVRDEFLLPYRARWADTMPGKLLNAARERAGELVQAKDLPHYPKSGRKTSDNKRIEFFSKVMAGLALRLAPLGATKRLSCWNPDKPYVAPAPIRATGPDCPHCGMAEVPGFAPGTVVRCPSCDERYYIAPR